MNFQIIDADQRSPAWFAARLGRLTGSRASDMLATIKSGGEAAGRRNLRAQLVLERITGRPQENGFVSPAMLQGIEREAAAYARYEALTGRMLARTGFLLSDDHAVGCSLDGHVGDFEGIVELKSPIAATHFEYLKTGNIPGEYHKQIVHGLWVSGARWCDWMSYNPDFPASIDAKLVRVARNDDEIAAYASKALAFLAEVDTEVAAFTTMTNLAAVLERAAAVGV